MYGKIFESMYDGTLVEHWQALVTFQQLLVLCDEDGIVDMTPYAIHHRTGIPLEILQNGLETLAEPDNQSRTPDEDGRRIVPLDPHRPWGWRIVNHDYYRNLARRTDKRVNAKERQRKKRQKDTATVTPPSHDVTLRNAPSRHFAHTDTDTDTDTEADTDSHPPTDEPQESGSTDDVNFLILACRGETVFKIMETDVDYFAKTFPNTDVRQELRNAVAWSDANPKKRKTAKGAKRFLTAWLTRSQATGDKRGLSNAQLHGRSDGTYTETPDEDIPWL